MAHAEKLSQKQNLVISLLGATKTVTNSVQQAFEFIVALHHIIMNLNIMETVSRDSFSWGR